MTELKRRGWVIKFRDAGRGIVAGVRDENSFLVHLPIAIAVVIVAGWLRVSVGEWCLLTLCIGGVLVAELFNSALERLAKAVTDQPNPHVGAALDMGSGAVLCAAMTAATVGLIILAPPLLARIVS